MVSDDFMHLPVAVQCQNASEQKWAHYPAIYGKAEAAVGSSTVSMTTDRGFHLKASFAHNLAKGVSTVGEWRQSRSGIWPENLECAEFDRDGVPRWAHCGDTTHTNGAGLGLHRDQRGKPVPASPPRRPPHRRLGEQPARVVFAGAAAAAAHQPHPQVLLGPDGIPQEQGWPVPAFRGRYNVAGNDYAERPKRRQSVPCQQLRASAGMFTEWLRACLRHDWFGLARHPIADAAVKRRTSGRGNWQAVMNRRDSMGLYLPYGTAAYALGLVPDALWPSQRAGP